MFFLIDNEFIFSWIDLDTDEFRKIWNKLDIIYYISRYRNSVIIFTIHVLFELLEMWIEPIHLHGAATSLLPDRRGMRELLNIFRHDETWRVLSIALFVTFVVCLRECEKQIGCWNAYRGDASFTNTLERFSGTWHISRERYEDINNIVGAYIMCDRFWSFIDVVEIGVKSTWMQWEWKIYRY